jgi:hypothetical protein
MNEEAVYKWRPAPITFTVAPDLAYQELEQIRESHGGKLTPKAVVQAAEPKSAPLHPLFEWRDKVAGNMYREWQARTVIKSIKVEYLTEEGTTRDRPGFLNVRVMEEDGTRKSYYQNSQVAITRPDEWLSAVGLAQSRIDSARRALDELLVIAKQSEDPDRLQKISLAAMALQTAHDVLRN